MNKISEPSQEFRGIINESETFKVFLRDKCQQDNNTSSKLR